MKTKHFVAEVEMKEILEFMREGKDCKIQVECDGIAWVTPIDATNFGTTVLTQELEAWQYEDFGDEEAYADWLTRAYYDFYFEFGNGYSIEIEFI